MQSSMLIPYQWHVPKVTPTWDDVSFRSSKDRIVSPFVVANQDVFVLFLLVGEMVCNDEVNGTVPIWPLCKHHGKGVDRSLPWSKVFSAGDALDLLDDMLL